MKEKALGRLLEVARDPFSALKDLREKRRIIGSTIGDVPEEIIHAAGLHPFLILGTNEPIRYAASLLPDNACSLARSNLELVIGYEGDFFDGFVLSQVCDTTQHLCDIWRKRFPDRYFENFLAPRQVSRPSAREWVATEMRRLIGSLSSYTGRQIGEEDLRRSIRLYNENRSLLRRLYEVKQRAPGLLSNREFFDVVRAGFFMEREEHTELLRELVEEAEGEAQRPEEERIPTILAGIVVEPTGIFDLLDEAGVNVVGDNLCTGSRYIYYDVKEDGDPVEALASRHVSRPHFSPIFSRAEGIYTDLLDLYRERGAQAIIYVHIKYCESQDYDLPDIKRRMRHEGIPFLVIETEYQTTHLALLKTRVQAFCEAVLGRV